MNKENLTSEHLAKHLPFELKVWDELNQRCIELTYRHSTIDAYSVGLSSLLHRYYDGHDLKPILRPLSDLTKEIEHNRERFIPIAEMFKAAYKQVYNYEPNLSEGWRELFEDENGLGSGYAFTEKVEGVKYRYGFSVEPTQILLTYDNGIRLHINQFILREKLIEWHFDVDNLIEKGLAIDINALETNPYT